MTGTFINYGASPKKRIAMAERRRKVLKVIQEDPSTTQDQLATMFGVNRSTISRDFKTITEELNTQSLEGWTLHRERILREIQSNKDLCMAKLEKLKKYPERGSRWMEEWSKLVQKEIRILGVESPERLMLESTKEFSKLEEDAAIDAALIHINESVIDITPKLKAIESNK